MKTKRKNISEEEIDEIVIAQAENDSVWEKPTRARKSKQRLADRKRIPRLKVFNQT